MKKSLVLLVSSGLFTLALTFGIVANNATTLNELGAKAGGCCIIAPSEYCMMPNGDVYSGVEDCM